MPFESFTDAMASPAETSDKIAFAAGYVSTWLVAVAIIGGIPYVGYRKLSAMKKAETVSKSVVSLLDGPNSDVEESFDFSVSGLPDEFQSLLNAKREEHLELWKEYRIGTSIEKQAHFTQVVLSTDVMAEGDPDETLTRLKPYYWLIGMGERTDLVLGVSTRDVLGGDDSESERDDTDEEFPKRFIN